MHLGISNPKKISLRRANFMLAALNNRRACTCMHFEPAAFGGEGILFISDLNFKMIKITSPPKHNGITNLDIMTQGIGSLSDKKV